MTTLIAGLLVIIVGLLFFIFWRLGDMLEYHRGTYKTVQQLKKLSLNPRTRIGTLDPYYGPPTQEEKLVKLGRASAARRVVVGGDPDSQLNKDLGALVEEENNDE